MKAYVTGANGFVGTWLTRHLEACGDEVVSASDRFDLTNTESVHREIVDAAPDVVYHLAARSHVGESWKDPAGTFTVNATGTLYVLDAALSCDVTPRVIVISSSEVYGTVTAEELPVVETAPLRPLTPYAVSKVAAEYLGVQAFLGTKVPVVVARAFNHVGPGQASNFVVSALAKRIVDAERTGATSLAVGNLDARRDFTDVRDVVRAYRLMATHGMPGATYNVASGTDIAISELVQRLLDLSGSKAKIEVDPKLVRPVELPVLRGSAAALTAATGWKPEIGLDQTLSDTLRYWRDRE